MKKLLQREAPQHLEEFRLANCKLTSDQTRKLLKYIQYKPRQQYDGNKDIWETIKVKDCQIRKLGLVRSNLDNASLPRLLGLIGSAKFLIDLDVSFNELNGSSLQELSKALAKNRRLQHLNLSWNEVKNNVVSKFDPNRGPWWQDKADKRRTAPLKPPAEMDAEEQEIIQNLCTFIKHNPKLLHLDLSHMGLSHLMLRELGPALRRAKAIISLHISGNPGVDKALRKYLHARVHCAPKIKTNHIDVIERDK